MRFVGLALFLLAIPVLAGLIQSDVKYRRWSWVALGASPFIQGWFHLYVAIVPWPLWPGYVKGMLVALPDVLAIATLLSTQRQGKAYLAVALAYVAYVAILGVSVVFANVPMAAFFSVWQIFRVTIVAIAVGRIASHESAPRYLIYGLAIGIAFQAGFSIQQRLQGFVQASGTMGHQNLLGMMCHFALLGCLGLMLSGDRHWLPKLGMVSAFTVVVLTGSRATVGFAAAGAVLLLALSLARRPTAKKMKVAAFGVMGMIFAAPVAYATLAERFAAAPIDDSYDERARFEQAAHAIIADHPMGVGANNYVVVANTQGYSDAAGVAWNATSRAANVHNVFLLLMAETGYLGIAGFIGLVLVGGLTALSTGWLKRPGFAYADLSLAIFVTACIVMIHSKWEWILVVESPQMLLGMVFGLAAGLKSQRSAILHRAAIARARAKREMSLADESKPKEGFFSPA